MTSFIFFCSWSIMQKGLNSEWFILCWCFPPWPPFILCTNQEVRGGGGAQSATRVQSMGFLFDGNFTSFSWRLMASACRLFPPPTHHQNLLPPPSLKSKRRMEKVTRFLLDVGGWDNREKKQRGCSKLWKKIIILCTLKFSSSVSCAPLKLDKFHWKVRKEEEEEWNFLLLPHYQSFLTL